MAKSEKNGILRNGNLRMIGIILGILLAAGGVIWGFATQSGNLDHAIINVAKVELKSEAVVLRVGKVEDAVIKMETDISYIQRDVGKILKKLEE